MNFGGTENQVLSVALKGKRLQPCRPAQTPGAPQNRSRHLRGAQHKLQVPEKVLAAIIQDPVLQTFESRALRQHAFILLQAHGPHTNTKIELSFEKTRADDDACAKGTRIARLADMAQAAHWKVHPP